MAIINGTSSNDILFSTVGSDILNGGAGIDTASYANAAKGITVNLKNGFASSAGNQLKLMPLGDSITFGISNSSIGDINSGGYRTPLFNELVANGLKVNFVGSLSNGPSDLRDRDHEGHRGATIREISKQVNGWLASFKPNIITLMIGTNDTRENITGKTIASRLSALIDQITAKAPGAHLLVSTVPPIDSVVEGTNRARVALEYNSGIPGVIQSKVNQGKHVSFVDMRSKLTLSDLADNLHPNAAGYRDIASFWYDAILDVGIDQDTLISIENVTGSAYNDVLKGDAGVNVINAGTGNDQLNSYDGKDILTGGAGADRFDFSSPRGGFDTITDFSSVDDIIRVSQARFGGGLNTGQIRPDQFRIGTAAITSSERFIYNPPNGFLLFDPDGTGATAPVHFAMLADGTPLNSSDISIV